MNKVKELNIVIGGEAGQGVQTMGRLLSEALAANGYSIMKLCIHYIIILIIRSSWIIIMISLRMKSEKPLRKLLINTDVNGG